MDKATCEKTIKDFFDRMGVTDVSILPIPEVEQATCAPEDFLYGMELKDDKTGTSIYLARAYSDHPNFPGDRWASFVAWYYMDIPGTRDTPPDVDMVSTDETPHLYTVIKRVFEHILDRRLDYAHQAFGEEDES